MGSKRSRQTCFSLLIIFFHGKIIKPMNAERRAALTPTQSDRFTRRKSLEMLRIRVKDFDPFPSEFEYVSSDHCYVIVHPGYSQKRYVRTDGEWPKGYGSYATYLENLKQLVTYLKGANELSIFAVEERVYTEGRYADGLSPPHSALTLVTKDEDGVIKKYIETPEGKIRQKPGIIFSFLEGEGIREVRFAGEWAWWSKDLGCLGIVANNFLNEGFNPKGINGCIFPKVPYSSSMWSNEMLEMLYSNVVEIPSPDQS